MNLEKRIQMLEMALAVCDENDADTLEMLAREAEQVYDEVWEAYKKEVGE